MHFHNLAIGEVVNIGDVSVTSAPLNHPGGATGYRVNYSGRSAAYVTDTEHRMGELDASILQFIEGVDLFIYDCTYTDDEYTSSTNSKVGWGHSTWQEGVRLAQAAGVKNLVIFHHDPSHDDLFMDEIARSAKELFAGAIVAQEGKICNLFQ
jgi:phosphoribosyl 1,2-cyclic phosphodiesterase